MLDVLRESSDYEMLSLHQKNPDILQEISADRKKQLDEEIEELQNQADELKAEIEELDPAGVEVIS